MARKGKHNAFSQPPQWGQAAGRGVPRGRHAAGAGLDAPAHRAVAPGRPSSYSAAHDSALIARRRRRRKRKRVATVVAVVLAVLVIGVGTAFGIYSAMLNDRLALHDRSEILTGNL